MTDREKWEALALRCETATGADREIDFAIDAALAAPAVIRGFQARAPYTASLDAITALIEREMPGWAQGSGTSPPSCSQGPAWASMTEMKDCDADPFVYAATEPLARCLAFCLAKAAKEPTDG